MSASRPAATIALGLVAAAAFAGCGGGKDDAKSDAVAPVVQVRNVVERFGAASARKDYQTICDRLIARSLSDNVEELGLPCELAFKQGLGGVTGAKLAVRYVELRGVKAYARVHTTATGQPASDDTIELIQSGGSWRISSLDAPAPSPKVTPAVLSAFRARFPWVVGG